MPLVRSERSRRLVVRGIVRALSNCIVLFSVVDDHVHVVVTCTETELRAVRLSLVNTVRGMADATPASSHVTPVESRTHLERLVRYLLDQTVRHGLVLHPALHSGSCYLDLVGARRLPGWSTRLFTALPRWRVENLHRAVGLNGMAITPASDADVRAEGAARLAYAAAMSTAACPTLRGRDAAVVAARTVTARVGSEAGIARGELSWALGISSRAVLRAEARPIDAAHAEAARLCLTLLHSVHPEIARYRIAPGVDAQI